MPVHKVVIALILLNLSHILVILLLMPLPDDVSDIFPDDVSDIFKCRSDVCLEAEASPRGSREAASRQKTCCLGVASMF